MVAKEGRRSSLSNTGPRCSLSPVSGRFEDERWSLGVSVLKLVREVRLWVESWGCPSSIQGAMSALGRSIDCEGFDKDVVEGLVPTTFLSPYHWTVFQLRRSGSKPVNNDCAPNDCNPVRPKWAGRRIGENVLSIVQIVKDSQPCSWPLSLSKMARVVTVGMMTASAPNVSFLPSVQA